jgi:hypothetical protein
LIVQLLGTGPVKAGRLEGQLLVWEKSPAVVILEIDIAVLL